MNILILAAPFECPTCSAQGENADMECDRNIEYKSCRMENDPVCVLAVSTPSSPRKVRARYCAGRKFYKKMKSRCEAKKTCILVMCDTPGCLVELPA